MGLRPPGNRPGERRLCGTQPISIGLNHPDASHPTERMRDTRDGCVHEFGQNTHLPGDITGPQA